MKNLKNLKTYESFIDNKSNGSINENIKDTVKNFGKMLKQFKDKYVKGAWYYFAVYLQKLGLLKKYGVAIYPYKEAAMEKTISFKDIETLHMNEAKIDLEHPNKNVINLNANDMYEELCEYFETKEPVFIWGAPGIGKTDIVRQVGKKFGVDVVVFTLSVRDPVDFIGLPSIEKVTITKPDGETEDKGVTTYNVPKVFPTDNGPEDKGGILFFDEMNRANSSVLASSLQLVLDRKVNEYELPSKWVIFAAGNRKEEVPTVTEIEPALANRFAHFNLVTSVSDWEKWALSPEGKTKEGEFKIDSDILAFVKFNSEYFHYLDPDDEAPTWCSPRSWTKASEAYAKYKKLVHSKGEKLSKEKVIRIVAQRVGLIAATQFVGFVELMSWLNPDDLDLVYDDPKNKKTPYPPKAGKTYKADIAYAFVLAIGYRRVKEKLTGTELNNLFDYAISLNQFEYGTALIQLIGKIHPYIKQMTEFGTNLKKWSDAYKEVLNIEK